MSATNNLTGDFFFNIKAEGTDGYYKMYIYIDKWNNHWILSVLWMEVF